MRKTYSPKAAEISRRWYVVDAAGVPLGRLASQVARVLMGKHKVGYAPHLDTGDFVIVLNSERVALTGRKESQKTYIRHSGYPGGLKTESVAELRKRKPERIVELAVKGMLPKGPLGRKLYRKLKVYAGSEHPHQAQQPEPMALIGRSA